MKVKYNSIDSFSISLNDFLTSRNISLKDDVTEITILIKSKASDADVNAVCTLTLGSGISKDIVNEAVLFNFEYTDFGPGLLEAGKTYKMGLGFKTANHTKFLEANLKNNSVYVDHDFIHD